MTDSGDEYLYQSLAARTSGGAILGRQDEAAEERASTSFASITTFPSKFDLTASNKGLDIPRSIQTRRRGSHDMRDNDWTRQRLIDAVAL